jgi:RND family efflux transporter MFP subunit
MNSLNSQFKKIFEKLAIHKTDKTFMFLSRIAICTIILTISVIAFLLLASIKPKPKQKNYDRLIKTLIATPVKKENVKEMCVGYGTAEPTRRVEVSSQVNGEGVYVMPNLKSGVLVNKDDVLVKITKVDYDVAQKKAIANIKFYKSLQAVLKQDIKDNIGILKILKNKLRLEEADYNRQKQLFQKKAVSAHAFEFAEQSLNEMAQICLKMQRDISKAKLELKSHDASIEIAEVEKIQAELDLNRCEIRSPITGRLEKVAVEENEYIIKGQKLFEVANDSSLSIPVSLDIRDAATILTPVTEKLNNYKHWFKYNKETPVLIRWVEEPERCVWEGEISRVEKFDSETRTITVVVKAIKFIGVGKNMLPLVAGMYCQTSFIGKESKDIVKIPWSALQLNGHVYVVDKNNVVHEKEIEIQSSRQDQVIISSGLNNGEKVIMQRIPYGIVSGSKVETVPDNNI